MNYIKTVVFTVIAISLSTSTTVRAHGGGGFDHDTCFVDTGDFHMGFVGYQPEKHPKDKFCHSFPSLGATVLTFDFIESELRALQTGVSIVKVDPLAPIGDDHADQSAETVAIEPPSVHSQGLLILAHEFTEPGRFVALVTVVDAEGKEHVGRFPFSVAAPIAKIVIYLYTAAAILFVSGYIIKLIRRRKYANAHQSNDPA